MDFEGISYLSAHMQDYAIALVISLLLSLAIYKTHDYHHHLTSDDVDGVQKFHSHSVPRVGGIAIYLTLWLVSFFLDNNSNGILRPVLYAVIPAFLSGLVEDITAKINPAIRLFSILLAGLLICLTTGISLKSLNVIGLDQLIAIPMISVLVTAFMLAGVANAINIIDGFNGLSSGSVIIFLSTFAGISFSVNDFYLGGICLLLAATILGFWLVNYPFGRLFLGDGGAYLIGFFLAWIAVLLPYRNGISSWVSLLVCSYPVIEVLVSIVRRKINGQDPSQPDCGHMHSLIKLVLVSRHFAHKPDWWRNSMVFIITLPYTLISQSLALAFYAERSQLVLAFIICALLYMSIYQYLAGKFQYLTQPQ